MQISSLPYFFVTVQIYNICNTLANVRKLKVFQNHPKNHCKQRNYHYLCTSKQINMDTLASFAKENFELITLLVGLLGVLVSIWAVYYEIKKKRKQKGKQEKSEDEE